MVFTSTIQILPHTDPNPTPAAYMYSTPHFSIFSLLSLFFMDEKVSIPRGGQITRQTARESGFDTQQGQRLLYIRGKNECGSHHGS